MRLDRKLRDSDPISLREITGVPPKEEETSPGGGGSKSAVGEGS